MADDPQPFATYADKLIDHFDRDFDMAGRPPRILGDEGGSGELEGVYGGVRRGLPRHRHPPHKFLSSQPTKTASTRSGPTRRTSPGLSTASVPRAHILRSSHRSRSLTPTWRSLSARRKAKSPRDAGRCSGRCPTHAPSLPISSARQCMPASTPICPIAPIPSCSMPFSITCSRRSPRGPASVSRSYTAGAPGRRQTPALWM